MEIRRAPEIPITPSGSPPVEGMTIVRNSQGSPESQSTEVTAGGKGNIFKRGLDKLGHAAGRGAELSKSAGEALIGRMGQVLEDRRAFGKSVADFALHGAATRGLSMGSRELAKGIVSYSGLVGALGGGLTGTVVAGAFVGAVSGAMLEYLRQVNKNIDEKMDPSLAGTRTAFVLKFKELRHGGVLKPSDTRKILIKGAFGAIAGTGAAALVEHTAIGDWLSEHTGGVLPFVKNAAGNVPVVEGVKSLAGGARDWAGETWQGAGEAKNAVGDALNHVYGVQDAKNLAGGAWHEVSDKAGNAKDWAGTVSGVKEVGNAADGVWHGAGEIVDNTKHAVGLGGVHEAVTPEGFVPQADFNALKDQVTHQAQDLTQTHQQIDDLQRQLDTLKHASGVSGAVIPPADAVTTAVVDQAHTALDHLGNSIPLPAGSNPWEMSTTILKQMGVNPTPEQIMQLDKVLSQENGISVPDWGIKGTIDARSLPIGFKLNLTDTVKKAALGIASKK